MSVAKVALGARLFADRQLSVGGQLACADCHRPEHAYGDTRALPLGALGDTLVRHAPTLTNVAYNPSYGWIGAQVQTLEQQMRTPLLTEHPVEMGLAGHESDMLARLGADPSYGEGFSLAFPGDTQPLSLDNVIKAIACFERTLISGRSPFDRYVFDDDRTALGDSAKRGMRLFYSRRAGCARCHGGINFSGPINSQATGPTMALFADSGNAPPSAGLEETTGRAEDRGKFKVPTLRNAALTAPYLHDGSVRDLPALIALYSQGGRQRHKRPLALTPRERSDLLAFLQSLSDPEFASGSVISLP